FTVLRIFLICPSEPVRGSHLDNCCSEVGSESRGVLDVLQLDAVSRASTVPGLVHHHEPLLHKVHIGPTCRAPEPTGTSEPESASMSILLLWILSWYVKQWACPIVWAPAQIGRIAFIGEEFGQGLDEPVSQTLLRPSVAQ
ncbi:hypothetical protein CRG98_033657, partial [Punica granatum]